MPPYARSLQEKAASLFLLAEEAFGRGRIQLGEELTAMALHYLDEANAIGTVFSPPAAEPERRAIQQQPQSKDEQ